MLYLFSCAAIFVSLPNYCLLQVAGKWFSGLDCDLSRCDLFVTYIALWQITSTNYIQLCLRLGNLWFSERRTFSSDFRNWSETTLLVILRCGMSIAYANPELKRLIGWFYLMSAARYMILKLTASSIGSSRTHQYALNVRVCTFSL
jgi:hypothetical protein